MADSYGLNENTKHLYGRRALAIARLTVTMARHPTVDRFIVYRTGGGPVKPPVVMAIPADGRAWVGEVVGVYGRDVTVRQLLDDLEEIDTPAVPRQKVAA